MPKKRDEDAPYWKQVRQAERHIIEYALEQCETIYRAAQILGVSPNFLSDKISQLGIDAPTAKKRKVGTNESIADKGQQEIDEVEDENVDEDPDDEEDALDDADEDADDESDDVDDDITEADTATQEVEDDGNHDELADDGAFSEEEEAEALADMFGEDDEDEDSEEDAANKPN